MNATREPMIEIRLISWGKAFDLGQASRDAFWEETGSVPTPENDGGWAESAWACHWHELRDAGAVDPHYDRCKKMWQDGFYAIQHEEDDYLEGLE